MCPAFSFGKKGTRLLDKALSRINSTCSSRVMTSLPPSPLMISDNPGSVTVFLHGMVMAPVFWETYTPDICRNGTAAAYPLPGHFPWQLGDAVATLSLDGVIRAYAAAIRRDFPGRAVTLVGHSTGGFFALGLAARYPELVEGTVLMGALACGGLDGIQPFPMRLLKGGGTLGQWTFERLLALWISSPSRFVAGSRSCIADAYVPPSDAEDRFALEAVRQSLVQSKTSEIAALVRLLSWSTLRDELANVRAPCLNIVGSHDKVIRPSHQLAIQRAVPGMTTMLLEGCGHLPMVERRQAVSAAMAGFLHMRHLAGLAMKVDGSPERHLAGNEKPRSVSAPGPLAGLSGSVAA